MQQGKRKGVGMSHPDSPRYLRRKLYHALKSKGVFQELKTNLRQKLIIELTSQTKQNQNNSLTVTNTENVDTVSLCLCMDFLKTKGYSYALSVLIPETKSENRKFYSRIELIDLLHLSKLNQQKCGDIEIKENESLISCIVSYMQRKDSVTAESVSVQTDQHFDSIVFQRKTSQLCNRSPFKRVFDPQEVANNFDANLNSLEGEIEGDICCEYSRKLQLQHFQDSRINELRMEMERFADAKLKERQVELELAYSAQKAALEEKEKQLRETITRDREVNERNAFFQRQTLVADIEAARAQAEKLRQLELDLERQRKEQQNEFYKRRTQLSEEERKIAAQKQEFDEVVRQEIERLRENDEIELIKRKRDIEMTESRIKVERAALDCQKMGILALQEEINEKATLFSQMEMLDYETVKSKLDASKKEASFLKESLAEALKEIEKLKQGAALASSERSLLTATRQENERLLTALEQERESRNQETRKLNVRIEELKAEKNRLEERVCLRENELSRLRGRLAERRSDVAYAVSPTGDMTGRLAPSKHIDEVVAQPSATVKTARERLRALEKESVELEATLGRWKEEIFTPSSTKSPLRPALDGSRPGPLPTNSLSKAFLTNMRTASSIPSLLQFPPSWPLPYTRSMNSVIGDFLSGTEDMVVKPKESAPVSRLSKNDFSTTRMAQTLSNVQRTEMCHEETEDRGNNPEATSDAQKSQNMSGEKSAIQPQSIAALVMLDKETSEKKSSNLEGSFSTRTMASVSGLAKEVSKITADPAESHKEVTKKALDTSLQDEDPHDSASSSLGNEEPPYTISGDDLGQQEVDETSAQTEKRGIEGASVLNGEEGKEQQEEGAPASESSSFAGIDPMIRKYMRVVKEKYEDKSPVELKDGNNKHPFLYSNLSDSDSTEKESDSREQSKDGASDEQENSEDFW